MAEVENSELINTALKHANKYFIFNLLVATIQNCIWFWIEGKLNSETAEILIKIGDFSCFELRNGDF